jgi:hypothetical protein
MAMKTPYADWINREDIREILNIPVDVSVWEECNDNFEYQVFQNASLWIYPKLKNKYRILFYSGTTDGAVPTKGSREWIRDLGWTVTEPWRPYMVNN